MQVTTASSNSSFPSWENPSSENLPPAIPDGTSLGTAGPDSAGSSAALTQPTEGGKTPSQGWVERLGRPDGRATQFAWSQDDPLGEFVAQNEQRRSNQDSMASHYNSSLLTSAMAVGEDLSPTMQNLRRLHMFNFDEGSLAASDRLALSESLQLGLSDSAALSIAPLIASVTDTTGLSIDETFAFGSTGHFPRSAWTASDFSMMGPWAKSPTQRAAFESALLQTGSSAQATNMAVLSTVRERLVDQLPAQILASQETDKPYLTRMHGAMVNGLLSTDVYFDTSIREILPRGYNRMSTADLPASLGLRSFEDVGSGYFGALYRNADNGTVIYANRGTEGPDKLDVRANILQAFGLESGQYIRAMDIADKLSQVYGEKLSYTGHSLGGGLASAQALVTGLPATTFNAAGLNPETVRRVLGNGFDSAWARGGSLVSAYFVQGDPLSQIQDGAQLPAGMAARGRQIAGAMAADHSLGFSAFNWSDKNLMLPLINGDLQSGRVPSLEANALPRAVGTRYALAPAAAPSWLNNQLGGMNPVPGGGALHSMATSVMYGLFGSVGGR